MCEDNPDGSSQPQSEAKRARLVSCNTADTVLLYFALEKAVDKQRLYTHIGSSCSPVFALCHSPQTGVAVCN